MFWLLKDELAGFHLGRAYIPPYSEPFLYLNLGTVATETRRDEPYGVACHAR